jgi:hypothetical protein
LYVGGTRKIGPGHSTCWQFDTFTFWRDTWLGGWVGGRAIVDAVSGRVCGFHPRQFNFSGCGNTGPTL